MFFKNLNSFDNFPLIYLFKLFPLSLPGSANIFLKEDISKLLNNNDNQKITKHG